MNIERRSAYYNKVLMGCANYEKTTDNYAGFQIMCVDCKEPKCPFKGEKPKEKCFECKFEHNLKKCPKCGLCAECGLN